jgi:hypothetical protein
MGIGEAQHGRTADRDYLLFHFFTGGISGLLYDSASLTVTQSAPDLW